MRSMPVLERRPDAPDAPAERVLLVLWQHPVTHEIVPIGRFTHDDGFSFRYTRAAASVPDFRPLPGLGDLNRTYRSDQLPAVFEQRVMEPTRPDYADYLRDIGLDPAHATPWEQIVNSGGERAGDTLQFMQIPAVINGRARARFLVSGVRHVPGPDRVIAGRTVRVTDTQHENALRSLHPGQSLRVEAERGKPGRCLRLRCHDGRCATRMGATRALRKCPRTPRCRASCGDRRSGWKPVNTVTSQVGARPQHASTGRFRVRPRGSLGAGRSSVSQRIRDTGNLQTSIQRHISTDFIK